MIKASKLEKCCEEICNFEYILCCFRIGVEYLMISNLLKLQILLNSQDGFDQQKVKIHHFVRWLQEEVNYIQINPIQLLFQSCYSQPLTSIVRKQILAILDNVNNDV